MLQNLAMPCVRLILLLAMMAAPASAAPASASRPDAQPLGAGQTVWAAGRQVTLTRLDDLPFIQDEYTARFTFDSHDNPKLKALRERHELEKVVAGGKTEFDRQILLLDWVHERIRKFGRPTSKARGALDILAANDEGHTFFCAHYGDVLVSAAASLGWVNRALALRRPDHLGKGSTEHTSTEIWSNDHRKWIMFDPTFAMYAEKDGVPLNAYELRQAWFDPASRGLTFVVGKKRKRYTKADLPVLRKRFDGFGDLSLDGSALNVYAFIGYIPSTNLMDAGPDYGRMFITQDAIGGATKWHQRTVPESPATDPYFPIGQADLTIAADGDRLRVEVGTLTPNFKTFLYRTDASDWQPADKPIRWTLHPGNNRLEVKTVNHFGVEGSVSTAEVVVGDAR